jgi:hypothetical protein
LPKTSRIDKNLAHSTGEIPMSTIQASYSHSTASTERILYEGVQTIQERGFQVDDVVEIGSFYSETGVIVSLNARRPYEAEVRMTYANGCKAVVWIDSKYLLKKCN